MADDDTDTSSDTGAGDKKDTPAQKKQVKNEHILIAVAVVTLLVMYVFMRKQAAAQANSNTTSTSPYGTAPYGYAINPASQYGGGDNPAYDSDLQNIASDLQQMQQEIVGLTPPTTPNTPVSGTTGPPAPDYSSEQLQGSGFSSGSAGSNPVQAIGGGSYAWLPNASAVQAAIQGGTPTFYQPTPGVFQPLAAGTQGAPGTPTFIKVT